MREANVSIRVGFPNLEDFELGAFPLEVTIRTDGAPVVVTEAIIEAIERGVRGGVYRWMGDNGANAVADAIENDPAYRARLRTALRMTDLECESGGGI